MNTHSWLYTRVFGYMRRLVYLSIFICYSVITAIERRRIMAEQNTNDFEDDVIREFYETMDYELFVEGKTISSSYPDELRNIQEDMIQTIAKMRLLKMKYKSQGGLPLNPNNSDFDCLNRTIDYMFEELLTLISDRHYVKKVYSDGRCISGLVRAND